MYHFKLVKWLKSLRLSIMRVSLHCGLPADAWYHGEQILKNVVADRAKNQSKEIDRGNLERALLMCAEAAISIKSEERLSGLIHWAQNLDLDLNLSWLKGVVRCSFDLLPALRAHFKFSFSVCL